ncbi:BgTH12-00641 [Blumeria graminis f. sp. triticale]|uniref:BgTH12-00641 n=1 Tax=Blumeria graminis f. sp. triticale TaxID=1689686 RepID=A0A9W4GHJ3_BLUGR|nr:hypothetical protein BGT96224_3894 [Blumeria graminis f. sp. tritici 96224]CAD6505146.1 BgTH12-00641 [Blumeria graminis f. sp. triticale]
MRLHIILTLCIASFASANKARSEETAMETTDMEAQSMDVTMSGEEMDESMDGSSMENSAAALSPADQPMAKSASESSSMAKAPMEGSMYASPMEKPGMMKPPMEGGKDKSMMEKPPMAKSTMDHSNAGGADVIIIWISNGGNDKVKNIKEAMPAPNPVTHKVVVGGSSGLVFTPDQVKADVGDMVVFQFMSNNHTATQSAFSSPCEPLANGMDSGFMPNVNNTKSPAPEMAVQVTVTTPLWFYCKQTAHCGKGMTFSINPGAEGSGKTQLDFKELAIKSSNKGAPPPIVGGAAPKMTPPPPNMPPSNMPPSKMPPPSDMSPMKPPPPPQMATGSGNMAGGVCSCSCLCGVSSFPNMANQGIGSYGGMPGGIPMGMMKTS